MIANLYNQIKADPTYNKIVGNDYLIVEYNCPIGTENFQLLTELNFIIYTISGRKDWMVAGKTYESNAGDALFIKKGVYTTRQYLEVDNCILLFFMSDDFIRKFLMENPGSISPIHGVTVHDPILHINVDDALASLFLSVFNYLRMDTVIPHNLVELKFRELLFNVILNPANNNLAAVFSSLMQSVKTNIDHVMMSNFHHDLPLEEFASLCGRSLSAFKRDFKTHYHQPPGKWLTEKRLELARNLLLNSDMNINEVCYESGFKNSTHFNKIFKEKYHLPPKKFRVQSEKN